MASFTPLHNNPTLNFVFHPDLVTAGLTTSVSDAGNGFTATLNGFENFVGQLPANGSNVADFSQLYVYTDAAQTALLAENVSVTIGPTVSTAVFGVGLASNATNATASLSGFESFVGNNGADFWTIANGTTFVTIHGGNGLNDFIAGAGNASLIGGAAAPTNLLNLLSTGGFATVDLTGSHALTGTANIAADLHSVGTTTYTDILTDITAVEAPSAGMLLYMSADSQAFFASQGALDASTLFGATGSEIDLAFANAANVTVSNTDFLHDTGTIADLALLGGATYTVVPTSGFSIPLIALTSLTGSAYVNLAGDSADHLTVIAGSAGTASIIGATPSVDTLSFAYDKDSSTVNLSAHSFTVGSETGTFSNVALAGNNFDDFLTWTPGQFASVNLATGLASVGGSFTATGFTGVIVAATDLVAASENLTGGASFDELVVQGVGTAGLADSNFSDISGFGVLDLQGIAFNGTTHTVIDLGSDSDLAGIQELILDTYTNTGTLKLEASSRIAGLTVLDDNAGNTLHLALPQGSNYVDVGSESATISGGQNNTEAINPNDAQFADGGFGSNTLLIAGSAGASISVALGASADVKTMAIQNLNGGATTGNAQFFQNLAVASTGTADINVYAEGLNQLSHTIVTGTGDDTLVGGFGSNFLDAGAGFNTLIAAGGSNLAAVNGTYATTQVLVGNAGGLDLIEAPGAANVTLMLEGSISGDYSANLAASAAALTSANAGSYYFDTTNNLLEANIEGAGVDYIGQFAAAGTTVTLNTIYSGTATTSYAFTDDLFAGNAPTIAADLFLTGGGATHNINLGTGGGFVDIPVDTGNVSVTNSGNAPVTVALDIDTTASLHLSADSNYGANELVLSGYDSLGGTLNMDAATIALPHAGTLVTSGFASVDASGVSGAAGFGMILGNPATTYNVTIVGSQGTDTLFGGSADDTLVATSGHGTIVADGNSLAAAATDQIILMPSQSACSETIDVVGGYTYNVGGGNFTSSLVAHPTLDFSNFGNVDEGLEGAVHAANGDLVFYLADAAGGGTVDFEGYFSKGGATLVGQDTLQGGLNEFAQTSNLAANQITFALGATVTSTLGIYDIVASSTATQLLSSYHNTQFFMGGGVSVGVTDNAGQGRVDFSMYGASFHGTEVLTNSTGILADFSSYSIGTGQGIVDQLSASDYGVLAGATSLLNLGTIAHATVETTAVLDASLLGIEEVRGTADNDIFIGPSLASTISFQQYGFAGLGGNNIYVNTDATANLIEIDYGASPGDIYINLSGSAQSAGTLSIASHTGYNGWGGIDTFIGGSGVLPNIIDAPQGNAVVWGSSQGVTLEAGGGNDTLVGVNGAVNAIAYDNNPGRLLGGKSASDGEMAGVAVNLSNTQTIIGAHTLSATTGYSTYGGTDNLQNVNVAIGSAYNDLLVGSNTWASTLEGAAGFNKLYGYAAGKGGLQATTAGYDESNSGIVVNFSATQNQTVTLTEVLGVGNTVTTNATLVANAATVMVDNGLGGLDSLVGINAVSGSSGGGDVIYSDHGFETYIGQNGVNTLILMGTASLNSTDFATHLTKISVVDLSHDSSAVTIDLSTDTAGMTVIGGSGSDSVTGNNLGNDFLTGNFAYTANLGAPSITYSTLLTAPTESNLSDLVITGSIATTAGLAIADADFAHFSNVAALTFSVTGTSNGIDLVGSTNLANAGVGTIDLSGMTGLTNTIALSGDTHAVTIDINSAELSTDTYGGSAGHDKLNLAASGTVTIADSSFAGGRISNIGDLSFSGAITTLHLTGSTNLAASGLSTFDLSAMGTSGLAAVNLASDSASATVIAGNHTDSVIGNGTNDTLILTDSGTYTLSASQVVSQFTGISVIDLTQLSASASISLDFSTDATPVTIFAGQGVENFTFNTSVTDTLIEGAGEVLQPSSGIAHLEIDYSLLPAVSPFNVPFNYASAPVTIIGAMPTAGVNLADADFAHWSADFDLVLDLTQGSGTHGVTLSASSNMASAGIATIDLSLMAATLSNTIDLSNDSTMVTIIPGTGNDSLIGNGASASDLVVLPSNLGTDHLSNFGTVQLNYSVLASPTLANIGHVVVTGVLGAGSATIGDTAFANMTNVTDLLASLTGGTSIVLTGGTHFGAAGIQTLDLSPTSANVTLDLSNDPDQVTVLGGSGADTITGNGQAAMTVSALNSADISIAGLAAPDTINFSGNHDVADLGHGFTYTDAGGSGVTFALSDSVLLSGNSDSVTVALDANVSFQPSNGVLQMAYNSHFVVGGTSDLLSLGNDVTMFLTAEAHLASDDVISLSGTGHSLSIANGDQFSGSGDIFAGNNHVVSVTAGLSDSISIGNSDQWTETVSANGQPSFGTGDILTGALSSGTISVGNSESLLFVTSTLASGIITTWGEFDAVTLTGSSDTLSIGNGESVASAVYSNRIAGSNAINLTGSDNLVSIGNSIVMVSGSNDSVLSYNTIVVTGDSNSIVLATNDTITGSGSDTIADHNTVSVTGNLNHVQFGTNDSFSEPAFQNNTFCLDGVDNTLELDAIGAGDTATAEGGIGNVISFAGQASAVTVSLSGGIGDAAIMGGQTASLFGFSALGLTPGQLSTDTYVGTVSGDALMEVELEGSGTLTVADSAFATVGVPLEELGFSSAITTLHLTGSTHLAASSFETIDLSNLSATSVATVDLSGDSAAETIIGGPGTMTLIGNGTAGNDLFVAGANVGPFVLQNFASEELDSSIFSGTAVTHVPWLEMTGSPASAGTDVLVTDSEFANKHTMTLLAFNVEGFDSAHGISFAAGSNFQASGASTIDLGPMEDTTNTISLSGDTNAVTVIAGDGVNSITGNAGGTDWVFIGSTAALAEFDLTNISRYDIDYSIFSSFQTYNTLSLTNAVEIAIAGDLGGGTVSIADSELASYESGNAPTLGFDFTDASGVTVVLGSDASAGPFHIFDFSLGSSTDDTIDLLTYARSGGAIVFGGSGTTLTVNSAVSVPLALEGNAVAVPLLNVNYAEAEAFVINAAATGALAAGVSGDLTAPSNAGGALTKEWGGVSDVDSVAATTLNVYGGGENDTFIGIGHTDSIIHPGEFIFDYNSGANQIYGLGGTYAKQVVVDFDQLTYGIGNSNSSDQYASVPGFISMSLDDTGNSAGSVNVTAPDSGVSTFTDTLVEPVAVIGAPGGIGPTDGNTFDLADALVLGNTFGVNATGFSIQGGGGGHNVIVLDNAVSLTGAAFAYFSGVQTLKLGASTSGAVDLSLTAAQGTDFLNSGVTLVDASADNYATTFDFSGVTYTTTATSFAETILGAEGHSNVFFGMDAGTGATVTNVLDGNNVNSVGGVSSTFTGGSGTHDYNVFVGHANSQTYHDVITNFDNQTGAPDYDTILVTVTVNTGGFEIGQSNVNTGAGFFSVASDGGTGSLLDLHLGNSQEYYVDLQNIATSSVGSLDDVFSANVVINSVDNNGGNLFAGYGGFNTFTWTNPDGSDYITIDGNLEHTGTNGMLILAGGAQSSALSIDLSQTDGGGSLNPNNGDNNGFLNAPSAVLRDLVGLDLSGLTVGSGTDVLVGGDIQGTDKSDAIGYTLIGGGAGEVSGTETLQGAGGNNTLYAGDGNETLIGGLHETSFALNGTTLDTSANNNTFVLFGYTPDSGFTPYNSHGPIQIENFGLANTATGQTGNDVLMLPSQVFGITNAANIYALTGSISNAATQGNESANDAQAVALAAAQGVKHAGFLVVGNSNGSNPGEEVFFFNPHDWAHQGAAEAYQIAQIGGAPGANLTAASLAAHISLANGPLAHVSHPS